jgi:hypothetical protein
MQRLIAGGPRPLELINMQDSVRSHVVLDIVPGTDPNLFTYGHEYRRVYCPLRIYRRSLAVLSPTVEILVFPGATRRQISDACTQALAQGIGLL